MQHLKARAAHTSSSGMLFLMPTMQHVHHAHEQISAISKTTIIKSHQINSAKSHKHLLCCLLLLFKLQPGQLCHSCGSFQYMILAASLLRAKYSSYRTLVMVLYTQQFSLLHSWHWSCSVGGYLTEYYHILGVYINIKSYHAPHATEKVQIWNK